MTSRYSPEASENQATLLPSGGQTGVRSAASMLRLRFRGSPFFTGTVVHDHPDPGDPLTVLNEILTRRFPRLKEEG